MKASEKIKILKKTLKKRNKDFAKDLGLAITSIANISSGKYGFTEAMAKKFQQAYRVSPPWLLFSIGPIFVDESNQEEERYVDMLRRLDGDNKALVYTILDFMNRRATDARPDASQEAEPIEDSLSHIPILGNIAAGDPILTLPTSMEESNETVIAYVPKHKKSSFYALRIKGNSMIEHRIHDGDIVIINKEAPPRDGCIAVCLVDGNTSTLKQIVFHSENKIELRPFNKEIESIWLSSKNELLIQGVLHQTIIKN